MYLFINAYRKQNKTKKGRWHGWKELLFLKDNDNNEEKIRDNVKKYLMFEVILSEKAKYGGNSLSYGSIVKNRKAKGDDIDKNYKLYVKERNEYANAFLDLFKYSDFNKIRFFHGCHPMEDKFDLDGLTKDEMFIAVDSNQIAAIWTRFIRLYG